LPFTSLFFSCSVAHRYLHSFPTRRSSDLWTGDGPAIDAGHFVAGAEIVAVIELIDLRSHLWFEPALKANRGHGGFSDDRELVGQNIFPLVSVSAENHQCGDLHARSGKLHGFAH